MKIEKSPGLTESEKLLARLGEKTFLGLWTWPNIHYCRPGKPAKEVCDLLVVCGKHVIAFSDKDIEFPDSGDLELDWSRWNRRAVTDSVKQLNKVKRYLHHTDRLFLDAKGTKPHPFEVPSANDMSFHGVVVARGAAKRCKKHFGSIRGSLIQWPTEQEAAPPFVIGDVNPKGDFYHVFDEDCLDIILEELNTVSDFVSYLQEKERVARSGAKILAEGEEELLTYFIHNVVTSRGRSLDLPDDPEISKYGKLALQIREGNWDDYVSSPGRQAKVLADRAGQLWDDLISLFAGSILDGTVLDFGQPMELKDHEKGLRYMALEPRHARRHYGQAILEALDLVEPGQRHARILMSNPTEEECSTGYVFMQFPYHEDYTTYDEYRQERAAHLDAYLINVYVTYPFLARVIGIATEPHRVKTHQSSSEELMIIEPGERTEEILQEAKELSEKFEVMIAERMKLFAYQSHEYPISPRMVAPRIEENPFYNPQSNPHRGVGRNDPCPCGSGNKFKKCCL